MPTRSRRRPLAAWAALHCGTLSLAAAGVRLWPHHPDPPESLALAELVAVQFVAAAVFFPVLLADPIGTAIAVAMALPMDVLAGTMSGTTVTTVVTTWALAGLWWAGLAGWARWARFPRTTAYLTVAATLLTIGGALLFYGRCESAAVAEQPWPDPAHFGPLMTGICSALGTRPTIIAWTVTVAPLLSTGLAISTTRIARRLRESGSPTTGGAT